MMGKRIRSIKGLIGKGGCLSDILMFWSVRGGGCGVCQMFKLE